MINLKYYLVLLISLFLSLGLGMVIGISLQSKNMLEKQHNILAQHLEDEFVSIRRENKELKNSLDSLQSIIEKNKKNNELTFNAIIRNKLCGLRVTLIETGAVDEFLDLINTLKIAGVSIESNLTLDIALFGENQEKENVIKVLLQNFMIKDELYQELAKNLLVTLSNGKSNSIIKSLNQMNLIHNSVDTREISDTIILAQSGNEGTKENIKKFVNTFANCAPNYGFSVIVVENEDNKSIEPNSYKRKSISTIDHVNTLYGRLSLVSLLYGTKGNYGYAKGVDGLFPNSLFPDMDVYRMDSQKEDDDNNMANIPD